MSKSHWMGVVCDSERHKSAIKSWFSPLCDDMVPESAEILCDAADREKKIRAVMVDENGNRHQAVRTKGRNYSISLKALP